MKNVVMDKFLEACKSGNATAVESLLPFVDPSANDNWAIGYTSGHGYVNIVRLLLTDPRVDSSARNNSAIRWASLNGDVEVVKLLLEDSRVDQSVIDIVRWSTYKSHVDVMRVFTEHQFRLDGPEYTKNII